ncbi:MAG: hypothetical protein PF489_09870, partial [Salinivirgaceae bacterium]|nr:hypothetical protein [Salinivirgaceae bacterium]
MINNMKIGVKLFLGFGITSFILLFVGVREYQVLQNLEDERIDMQTANDLADAVMEAKFELKTDLQLVMEMLNSNNLSKLKSYFAEHQELTAKFDAVLETVIRISSDASWGPEYKSGKNEILSTAEELDQT